MMLNPVTIDARATTCGYANDADRPSRHRRHGRRNVANRDDARTIRDVEPLPNPDDFDTTNYRYASDGCHRSRQDLLVHALASAHGEEHREHDRSQQSSTFQPITSGSLS
jgi:hypothetical protein